MEVYIISNRCSPTPNYYMNTFDCYGINHIPIHLPHNMVEVEVVVQVMVIMVVLIKHQEKELIL